MATKENAVKTKLAFEGEQEYKESCAAINSSLKVMASEMKLVTAQYANNADSTEALTSKQKVLQQQYDAQKAKVEATKKALESLEAQDERNEAAISRFKIALNNAETALVKTGNELSSTEKQLAENKNETDTLSTSTDKLSEVIEDSGKKAEKAGDGFNKFKSVLGGIAKGIAAFGTAAVGMGTALAALTVQTSNYADDILTQSTNTRQSTDDLQQYAHACKLIDVDLNTLTGSMAKNIKAMSEAKNGSEAIATAYADLNIEVKDADGNLRDSNDVYWEVIDALKNVSNETERDALSMKLLGESATNLNTVIEAGSQKFKETGAQAKELGAVMSGEALEAFGSFNDKTQILNTSLGGLKNAAALIALPFLDTLATDGTSILAEFSKGVQGTDGDITKMGSVIGDTLSSIIGLLVDNMPKLIEMGVSIIESVITGISANAPQLADAALKIISTIMNSIKDLLPILVTGALDLIQALALGLAQFLPELIPSIVTIIVQIVTTLAENVPMLINCAILLINGLIQGMISAIPVIIAAIPDIIFAIVTAFTSGEVDFIEIGKNIMRGLLDGITSMFVAVWESIKNFFKGIINGVKKMLDINSPSGVFEEIGDYSAQGIGVGFAKRMQSVTEDIKRSIPTEFEMGSKISVAISPDYAIEGGGYSVASRGGNVQNNTTGGGSLRAPLQIIQNIYTPQYDYAAQQREAKKQFQRLAQQF